VNVAFLLTQDRGGPVDLTVSLAQELAARADGPRVSIVGPAGVVAEPPALLHPTHVRSKADVAGFAAVARALSSLAPDVIHAQDRRAGLVASVVAGRRIPVVMTMHGVPDRAAGRWVTAGPLHGRRPGISGGSRLIADAVVARRVSCTVAPSRAMAAFLHRELRVPLHRVTVIHSGVRIPAPRRREREIGTFATIGSFAPCKATPRLVEAFIPIAAQEPSLRLRMIGDGADRAHCETLVRAAGIDGRVEFTGYRSDIEAQLERADVFVLPSVNENLPLALLEAMASGLPCIASDVGGVHEVLDNGCGVLVAPGDIRALGAAMNRLIADPELAARLGTAARRRVATQFSLARCADEHLSLWSDIVERRRR